jgi:hypothetical protein
MLLRMSTGSEASSTRTDFGRKSIGYPIAAKSSAR